ncbi:MAG TPA: hypothetical protein VMJ34_06755 [Bryobacteraceae bacterium]|nr:hypothetical protein [Bryobacteraceae bacterium]
MKLGFYAVLMLLAPAAVAQAQLDQYVGEWGGYAGWSTSISGQVDLTSRFVKTTVKKTSAGAIELTANQWGAKAAMRFDKAAQKFLLNWSADGFPAVTDVPLMEAAGGFTGTSTFACDGGECRATAEIKPKDGGGSDWEMVVTRGRDRFRVSLTLGKEK